MTGTTSLTGGRRKKRKGALTSTTSYSMTSSALCRTEGLTLLDSRFDKIEEMYAEDDADLDDGVSLAPSSYTVSTAATGMTSGGGKQREDFDSIMDDFLGSYSTTGRKKKRLQNVAAQTPGTGRDGKGGMGHGGLEHLDEIVSLTSSSAACCCGG
jgi:protein LTV1